MRLKETDLWSDFDKARPALLGALYSAVSYGLRHPSKLTGLPRMADSAAFIVLLYLRP
jgi:hypothetical protein